MSAAQASPYAVLCLPVLFAAGMLLFDTLDGAFMNVAYGWALSDPVRKIYYNITITVLSVAVALQVGAIELLGLLHGGPSVDLMARRAHRGAMGGPSRSGLTPRP